MAKVISERDPNWSIGRNPWCVGFIDLLLKIGVLSIEEINPAYSVLNPFKNWGCDRVHNCSDVSVYFLDAKPEVEDMFEKFIKDKVLVRHPGDKIALSGCSQLWMSKLIDINSDY